MKKMTSLKIFFDRIFNKVVKVDEIEKIQEGLERQKQAVLKIREAYFNASGLLEQKQNEQKKKKSQEEQFLKLLDKAKEKDDKQLGKQIFDEMSVIKNSLILLQEQIEKQTITVDVLKKEKEKRENEVRTTESNMELMKSKNDFTKSMKEYNTIFGEFEEFNIDDIERKIDTEFNATNCQIKEDDNKINLNKLQNESDFEEMWGK
jgi:riboflavin synthase